MRGIVILFAAIVLSVFWQPDANAEVPLSLESIVAGNGTWKIEATAAYANSERSGVQTGDPLTIQTGPTSFVTLPARIGEIRTNADTVVGSLGARYGIGANTDLYGRASYRWSNARYSGIGGIGAETDNRFADAWAGINHRFREDGISPALLGFAEMALRERGRESSAAGKSALFGLTAYHALDPVVLSMTGAYRINRERRDGSFLSKPGDFLLLNPSVAFAANDRVTLSTGLQWTNRQADRQDGVTTGYRRTATDLVLGLGFAGDEKMILQVTAKANISGSDGAEIRFTLVRTLDGPASRGAVPAISTLERR